MYQMYTVDNSSHTTWSVTHKMCPGPGQPSLIQNSALSYIDISS